ncbi:MAG TPA: amidohydrolase family protein [Cyclobacteriaceae bacterium]|nr:amidohydrolase family protein [Cyclobacteriaceae bacterium]
MPDQLIDAHQHFWKFDPIRDSWITDDMAVIQRDFFPNDLKPLLKHHNIKGCVAVQADQSEVENVFLLSLADQEDFIMGVVGWIDLQAEDVGEKLAKYKEHKELKGFRHILQGEKQRDFMLRPSFLSGINKLNQFNYTYDILIFHDQLKFTEEFVKKFPNQPFVIDHIAKPYIKDKKIDEWKQDMNAIAKYENVSCKISGMVTEADWKNWKHGDFRPYLDVVVEAFGMRRIMYGSDWPVCLVAASYDNMFSIVRDYFSTFSAAEQNMFFGDNAIKFYNL